MEDQGRSRFATMLSKPSTQPRLPLISRRLLMTSRFLLASFVIALAASLHAADEPAQPSAKEMLKARLAEETKSSPVKPAPVANGQAAPNQTTTGPSTTTSSTEKNPIVATGPGVAADVPTAKPKAAEPPTVLPKVEVKKGRITALDQELAKKDEEIAREKKNTRPSEVDKALNDSKIAKPLAIFGGESTQFRQHVSSERVSLMEDEKDLIEAIAHAKTKAEKAELQKQLDALRAERRELEKALR